jgi:hypothetical protein
MPTVFERAGMAETSGRMVRSTQPVGIWVEHLRSVDKRCYEDRGPGFHARKIFASSYLYISAIWLDLNEIVIPAN